MVFEFRPTIAVVESHQDYDQKKHRKPATSSSHLVLSLTECSLQINSSLSVVNVSPFYFIILFNMNIVQDVKAVAKLCIRSPQIASIRPPR